MVVSLRHRWPIATKIHDVANYNVTIAMLIFVYYNIRFNVLAQISARSCSSYKYIQIKKTIKILHLSDPHHQLKQNLNHQSTPSIHTSTINYNSFSIHKARSIQHHVSFSTRSTFLSYSALMASSPLPLCDLKLGFLVRAFESRLGFRFWVDFVIQAPSFGAPFCLRSFAVLEFRASATFCV